VNVKISESAYRDLVDGFNFYESQEVVLGDYFQDSLFSDIDSLMLYAGVHSVCYGKYRCLSKRFPYFIYYTICDYTVVVTAVLDCRRNPEWTKNKLK